MQESPVLFSHDIGVAPKNQALILLNYKKGLNENSSSNKHDRSLEYKRKETGKDSWND